MAAEKVYISQYSPLWRHCLERVKDFAKKSYDNDGNYNREKFIRQMVNRVNKITNMEKLYYTIAVLEHLGATEDKEDKMGYQFAVDVYNGKITMEILTKGRNW